MSPNDIVIIAAKRTPVGNMSGALSGLSAPRLQAVSHRAALETAQLDPRHIDAVISGCVLQAGIGQAPARQAAVFAGIPYQAGAVTVNKMCGSGMQALMMAHDSILAAPEQIILAGGMESMSNAPYLLTRARTGYRLGHGEIKDHMFLDGLEDAYDAGQLMGYFAEDTAEKYQFSRAMQDDFAMRSLNRALMAQEQGCFAAEIAPVSVQGKTESFLVMQDECPDVGKIAKIPRLRPAFKAEGTVTAANASSISDGAASLILCTHATALQHGCKPMARIVAHATHAQEPAWFTTAPVHAINRVLNKAGWDCGSVDLFEINEAFAVVTMAAIHDLQLDPERVNVHGGACALGHPIGASGARIVVTLLHALQRYHKKRGIASLCIGGGEATALAIECL